MPALLTSHSAWIPNTDLTPITAEECRDAPEKGKSKLLIEAFKVAGEEHDIDYFKDMIIAHEEAMQVEKDAKAEKEAEKEAEKAQKAAAKATKSDKKKRKSEVKADDDVEMEDVDEAPKKSSKKRKKDAESDDEETEKVCHANCDVQSPLIIANSLQRLLKLPNSS